MMIINVSTTLWNQIMTSLDIDIGISVDTMTGITAEKNKIDDTDNTATIKRVASSVSTTIKEGRKISEIDIAAALAVNKASGA